MVFDVRHLKPLVVVEIHYSQYVSSSQCADPQGHYFKYERSRFKQYAKRERRKF